MAAPDVSKVQEVKWQQSPVFINRRRRLRQMMRDMRKRRMIALILAVPLIWIGIELWHRFNDAFDARPVRIVRPIGSSETVPGVETPEFVSAMSALTETSMLPGNNIELLLDGEATLTGIEADVAVATRSVQIQTYYCAPGRVAERLKTLMITKAIQGLNVQFLPDDFGCSSLGDGYMDSLRAAGVKVAVMRPFKWYSLHRSLHRSHVRAAIIDSRIAYTGGFGFADKWLPNKEGPPWQ